jgi:hypothetical protein
MSNESSLVPTTASASTNFLKSFLVNREDGSSYEMVAVDLNDAKDHLLYMAGIKSVEEIGGGVR